MTDSGFGGFEGHPRMRGCTQSTFCVVDRVGAAAQAAACVVGRVGAAACSLLDTHFGRFVAVVMWCLRTMSSDINVCVC